MIQHEARYLEFIVARGVGKKDQVASSPKSYLSYLRSTSTLVDADISPGLLPDVAAIDRVVSRIRDRRAPGTVRNYVSAMRQYVAMVQQYRL